MPITNANGIDIYYELHGQGAPLVLIAGYTGDHGFWNFMIPGLAKKFRVLVFDNRAIGQTKDNGSPFTLETMAADTMALINKLELKNPHIVGQSMGGAIAQIIAKNYADQIGKLIILNSCAKFNTRTARVLESILSARKANTAFDLFINLALPWFFGNRFLENSELTAVFKEALINNPYAQSVADQERQLRALSPFDSRSWINDIPSPALVIAGEEDIIALPHESHGLAEGLQNATFEIVSGAHSSPVEDYHRVNELIFKFLG